jgi:LacI family transcriptional regulator, galactose operon repressor
MDNHKNNNIRLSDIAEKLNYSTSTVSKALSNNINVPVQTATHIQNIAEKMGYVPNIFARNLSARKSNLIGIIVSKITDIFISNLVESMYDITFGSRYSIILMVSQGNASREKNQLEMLLSMNVAGIIISITQATKDYRIFEKIRSRSVPVIYVNKIPEMRGINNINTTDYETALKYTKQAISSGYNNIAYTGFTSEYRINQNEFRNFESYIINRKETSLLIRLPDLIFTTLQTLIETSSI